MSTPEIKPTRRVLLGSQAIQTLLITWVVAIALGCLVYQFTRPNPKLTSSAKSQEVLSASTP